jgi:hypothetical protein
MTRSEADTFLEDASRNERFVARSGVRVERLTCLVCGVHIGSGNPTIQIRGALVHMRCAVYRRRLVLR